MTDGYFDVHLLVTAQGTTTGAGVMSATDLQIPTGHIPRWIHVQGVEGGLLWRYAETTVYTSVATTEQLPNPTVGAQFLEPGRLFTCLGTGLAASTAYKITIGCKAVDPRFFPSCD